MTANVVTTIGTGSTASSINNNANINHQVRKRQQEGHSPTKNTNSSIPSRSSSIPPSSFSSSFKNDDFHFDSSSSSKSSLWNRSAQNGLFILTIISIILRLYYINEPSEVVFDEVHFGGFASKYLRHEYFFDVHPPLGKLIIAGIGWLAGYDGGFSFGTIGQSYAGTTVPYVMMRMVMAAFGWATIALAYSTMIEMGFNVMTAGFTSALLVFDNALTVQTRYILLDSPLLAFIMMAIYSWTKFRQQRSTSNPFSNASWWGWLICTGIALGCATGVKLVGIFIIATIGIATIIDLWELADPSKYGLSDKKLWNHFWARALCLGILPVVLYISFYYVHFAMLYRTGPGDGFMSPEFQSTLEGNQLHATSRMVKFGQSIRFKSRMEEVFLHSHKHNYPLQHDDGKISSQGQQVTGYPAEDSNNLWKLENANNTLSTDQIRHGDWIRISHVATGKYLKTHDVASPLTRTNMEITVIDDSPEISRESTIWMIDVKIGNTGVSAKIGSAVSVMTKSTHFRLINIQHKVALTNQQQPLPKWGFGQREINGDKRGTDEACKWIVWDVNEPLSPREKEEISKRKKGRMGFFSKFWELQTISIKHNSVMIDKHPFKSNPSSWPFVLRGVSFWDKGKEARIYLLGNPIAWYTCLLGLVLFAAQSLKLLIRLRRDRVKNKRESWGFQSRTGYLFIAWILHYLPFFTMVRTLYLHHYLPAYVLGTMVTGATIEYLYQNSDKKRKKIILGLLLIILLATIYTFFLFSPITYGGRMATHVLNHRKWISTWDWP